MPALPSDLRKTLDGAVQAARRTAEGAARDALALLAVDKPEPYATMTLDQKRLRNSLRAKARQLGGGDGLQGFGPLVEEVAYAQWHRMLFARFLAENGLLMHPSGVAVTLAECAELAVEEGREGEDAWNVAARYAGAMLPGIFRADDPEVYVRFAPEDHRALERILADLPAAVFTADDALGWVYQFWQTAQKKTVNASGKRIGAAELPPVTQLFTEHYMVQFLLENSLGAWWAARHPDSPLLRDYTYLRYRDDRSPAAGAFPGWPARVAEVTVMDPCCGSGHFLVAAHEMLRRMRMEEEGLDAAAASDAVLRDNLFGLELDPRCTQIAAFALALTAWKAGGYRELPLPNVACSGIAVGGRVEEWTRLAGEDARLAETLERLYYLFRDAPTLGSLINPAAVPLQQRLFSVDYAEVEPLLKRALSKRRAGSADDPAAAVFGAAAEGIARAATLLSGTYTLVTTNVPYLRRGKQSKELMDFSNERSPEGKADLATVFLERCRAFTNVSGSFAIVMPQNWLFLDAYKQLRIRFLKEQQWNHLGRLGKNAFETITGEVVNVVLAILTNHPVMSEQVITGVDVSAIKAASAKGAALQRNPIITTTQNSQLGNPDARVVFDSSAQGVLLSSYAWCYQGMKTGDDDRLRRYFWELVSTAPSWRFYESTVPDNAVFGGREYILDWRHNGNDMARLQGVAAWNKNGVSVSQMGNLGATLYCGDAFDSNAGVIVPKDGTHLPAIWAFCQSQQYKMSVRQIDKKMNIANASLAKVPFDLEYWQAVADAAGPLPEPYSNDPTQWLFKGQPAESTDPLQVAVARLLGYRWPQQPPEPDALDALADNDGIVCVPSVAGYPPAAERLRTLLAAAYGEDWSSGQQERLLAAAGFGGKGLEAWLRDGFFAGHCRLFHNRPFVWQVWDGRKDGFSALLNYHRLDAACLDRLIYSYLDRWIDAQNEQRQQAERQGADVSPELVGAGARLVAAQQLKARLRAIREGEATPDRKDGYDIYVRWKPLHRQPLGWEPDPNDGVRLNVRPFVRADVLRNRFTVNWNKDRGHNPDGSERLNDSHYTLADKRAARATAETERQL